MGSFYFILGVIFCMTASSSEVVSVDAKKPLLFLSLDKITPLEKADQICVIRKKKDIACGEVISINAKYAVANYSINKEEIKKSLKNTKKELIIELDFSYLTPEVGDPIRILSKDPKKSIRALASELVGVNIFGGDVISEKKQQELDSTIEKMEAAKPFIPVSILTLGMNYVFPTFQYQQAITKKWGLGIMPTYMNYALTEGSLKGLGTFFTYNRYGTSPFNGFWWQFSIGIYNLTATYMNQPGSSLYAPAVLGTVGWRFSWKERMNFGFGLGSQYLLTSKNPGGTGLVFNGIIPALVFDAGLAF